MDIENYIFKAIICCWLFVTYMYACFVLKIISSVPETCAAIYLGNFVTLKTFILMIVNALCCVCVCGYLRVCIIRICERMGMCVVINLQAVTRLNWNAQQLHSCFICASGFGGSIAKYMDWIFNCLYTQDFYGLFGWK